MNWIEVTGKFDFNHLNPNERYQIVYVLKFKVDAFGWHSCPVKFKLTTADGQATEISEILEPYRKLSDIWHEIERPVKEQFTLECMRLGVILKSVKIRPKARV